MGFNFTAKMSDNASNSHSYQQLFLSSELETCREEYLTISSKNIKDQKVDIMLEAKLNSSYPDSQLSSIFLNGLIGYR